MKKTLFILIVITFLGCGLRLYNLTSSPAGLYVDEASIGYNAWSIITTGKDEHGASWPLFFEAFGEYKLPIYIYFVALFELFLGPVDVAVRLPAVIFGTLTIPAMFFLAKELIEDTNSTKPHLWEKGGKRELEELVPLISALLLAISPWHFQYTHIGFESSVAIFYIVCAIALFLRSARKSSSLLLLSSIFCFGMTFYSYNSARIVTPLVIFVLVLNYFSNFSYKQWIGGVIMTIVVCFPFLIFSNSPQGLARALQVSYVFEPIPLTTKANTFLTNYLPNILPETLFITGEPTIARDTPHRWGLLYLAEMPFFFVGVVLLFKRGRKDKKMLFMLLFFLIAVLPPAVATTNPHALRASLAIPAAMYITALGFVYIFQKSWLFRSNIRTILYFKLVFLTTLLLILGISVIQFMVIYHTRYTVDAGWDFHVDIKQASLKIKEIKNNYSAVYIDNSYWGDTRIVYLWHLKYPPALFQSAQNKNVLGKYHFEVSDIKSIPKNGTNLFVSRTYFTNLVPIETVVYPNNEAAIWMYQR